MRKFLVFLAAFTLFSTLSLSALAVSGSPGMPSSDDVRFLLNKAIPNGATSRLGNQVVDHKVQLAKGTYRYATSGGRSVVLPSTVLAKLKDVDGKDLVLPKNAVIKQVLIDVVNAPTASAASGFSAPQMALGVNTDTDLKGYTAVASYTGRVAGTQVGTAATMSKVLGKSAVTLNMKNGSVVSGDLNVFIEYYLSD